MVNVQNIANEVALEAAIFATEPSPGVRTTPTARLLGEWTSKPGRGLIRRSEDATGLYDRTTRATRRTVVDPSGSYTEDLTYETFPTHMSIGVQGGVAGVSDNEATPGYLRSYTPSGNVDDMDTLTVQHGINGLAWETIAVRWGEWNIAGDATNAEGAITFSGTPFMKDVYPLPGWFEGIATGGTLGTNAVQELEITGTPTGGTFTLTFRGQTTAAIDHDATAGEVEDALEVLSTIGVGNVACGGGALPGSPVTITFTGDLAATALPLVTANGAALSGGSAPAAAVTETTPGDSEGTIVMTGAGWSVDEYEGAFVFIDYGTHIGPVRQIISNTSDTLTITGPRLDAAVSASDVFYISGMFPVVPNADYETITMEGLEVYMDAYDPMASTVGTTLISDRVVSFNVTQTLNLARKRRASGVIARVGRGAREISGVVRLELDRPDEVNNWLAGDHVSLRFQKKGSVIDATATPTPTTKLFRIDLECVEIDDFTPDADNNNRTASFAFVALLPDSEPIATFDSITTLPMLP